MVRTLKEGREQRIKRARLEIVMLELMLTDHSKKFFDCIPKGHKAFDHFISADIITQRITNLSAELHNLLKFFNYDTCVALNQKARELACQIVDEASEGVFDESSPDYGNHQVTNFVNLFKLVDANAEIADSCNIREAIEQVFSSQDSE